MNNKYHEEFIDALLKIQTKKEMEAFLHGILTPKEHIELPKRLAIFKLLQKEIPQHTIADKLGVGIATVTRGSLELHREQIQKTAWWHNLSSMRG